MLVTPLMLTWLFGAAYAPAIPAALVLVVANAISSANMILQDGARGLGTSNTVLWSELTGLVVTVTCLAVLLRPYEIMGAAIASLLGYAAVTVILLLRLTRIADRSILFFLWPTREDLQASGTTFSVHT